MPDRDDADVGGHRELAPELATALLPPLVREAETAVLVVDLSRREVTYANDVAGQLAPTATLPIAVDAWSAAAGLADVSGTDLPSGGQAPATAVESLLRIAQGEPVTGEPVTAARATSATGVREVLWVIGLPLTGAPEPMASLALVVFLPARDARLLAGAQESAATLRDRAVLATRVSFTITDPAQPDGPLVWVNPAFTLTTGYDADDAIGRNCRFLQGVDTDRSVVAEIRERLRAERPVTTTLLNYRKDGTPFWNELSISPVRDHRGVVTHFVGVQADVTARVDAQLARDDALERAARAAGRLSLLSELTDRMARTHSPDGIVRLVGEVLVPRLASWCVVHTVDGDGHWREPVIAQPDGHSGLDPDALNRWLVADLAADNPVCRVMSGAATEIVLTRDATDDVAGEMLADLGATVVAVVPLRSRRGVLGCVAMVNGPGRPPLGSDDLALARDAADRAGLLLENALLYARERATASTLQRSLLPRLPRVGGAQVAAAYVPADDEAAVGGDWYDVFALRDGDGFAVVVGDVMGHNVDSAARMGKLSTTVRAFGWLGDGPHDVLQTADEFVRTSNQVLATCFYATVRPVAGGVRLRYSSAGHPPAVLRRPDGTAEILTGGRGPMIGIGGLLAPTARRRVDAELDLASGSTLIAFTDGLVDAFAEVPDVDLGLRELVRITAGQPLDRTPQDLVDVLTAAVAERRDDVAVVAVRID